ncbi:unnamed protein product [Rotaria sordida]|uniref:Uncharacterized protein n=1 Tax=Rotaria sordida TaxID=392033 RepID=A0A816D5C2_9BILA|nr:unnamed protein product [Rotaria sordida]CAF1630492.1 unnamed protein product [Rotaria sordida]
MFEHEKCYLVGENPTYDNLAELMFRVGDYDRIREIHRVCDTVDALDFLITETSIIRLQNSGYNIPSMSLM